MPDVDIPNQVASQSFLNQTGNLATTTLFTPASAGNFRVAVYGDTVPNGGAVSNPVVTISWTDENQAQSMQITLALAGATQHLFTQEQIFFHSVASAITVAVSDPNSVGYNLFVSVEQL